jgi:tellurite methyltransferase
MMPTESHQPKDIAMFFDELYLGEPRYWWREDTRYSTNPADHPTSLLAQGTLRKLHRGQAQQAAQAPPRALDLGAGEGADSIRLALLGYSVDAIEISPVGASKISDFAAKVGVQVNVQVADVSTYMPGEEYDVIICNGLLHYVEDKSSVVERMQRATRTGGINVVSLWSTRTPVPSCHEVVPTYPDDEHGVVHKLYQDWDLDLMYFEADKRESSHSGMPDHSHSHIKLIAQKPAKACSA